MIDDAAADDLRVLDQHEAAGPAGSCRERIERDGERGCATRPRRPRCGRRRSAGRAERSPVSITRSIRSIRASKRPVNSLSSSGCRRVAAAARARTTRARKTLVSIGGRLLVARDLAALDEDLLIERNADRLARVCRDRCTRDVQASMRGNLARSCRSERTAAYRRHAAARSRSGRQ